jgi:tetratricopeptide (TPR) repeat protein
VLSTFFLMLTLGSYALYSEKRTAGHYALVAGLLALGLMSKAMLVTTPFLLLLLDFWPLERTRQIPFGQLVREKIPLLIIAIASSVVTFIVQQSGGAVRGLEAFPLPMRIGNAIVSYAEYMRLMIWPSGLAAFYPYPEFPSPGIIALSAIILAAITAAVIRYRTSHPYLLVGWLWYLGTLVPVIGLVQVGNQAMADRYTYIPLIGLFVIVAWGAHDVIAQRALPKWVMPAAATAVLLAFAVVTGRQVTYWRDSTTLWTHALSVTSDNYVAHNNLGRELTEAGRIDQAVAQYDSALAIKPQYATARTNRGVALAKQGKYDDAIAIYKGAIAIKPDLPEAHINLGAAFASQGRNDEAIEEYRTAIRLNPNLADAHADLGLALGKTGKVDEALKEYATALSIRPDFVEVHNNFGFALAAQGKNAEAIPHFNAALALKPEFVLARLNLAMTLSNYGKKNEAVREFSEVLKYDPNNQLAKESIEMLSRR